MQLWDTCAIFPGVHVMIKWFGMQESQSDRWDAWERWQRSLIRCSANGTQTLWAKWNCAEKGFDKFWLCLERISFPACHAEMCNVSWSLHSVAVSLDRQIFYAFIKCGDMFAMGCLNLIQWTASVEMCSIVVVVVGWGGGVRFSSSYQSVSLIQAQP